MWLQLLLPLSGVIILCFAFVIARGAPYLPTLKDQVRAAFDLAGLKPGDTILELGCGDGRVLIEAANRGLKAVGYELNPILYLFCLIRTRKFRRQGKIKVVLGDFWGRAWPEAQAVYVFLLPRLMDKLDRKISADAPKGIKVVSFAFKFPKRQPAKEQAGVFLYQF